MNKLDSAVFTGKQVALENFRVHYVEAGRGHPVVLLHGSGPGATGTTNFHSNIGALARHFRLIVPDMPGWGQSDTQTDLTGRDHVGVLLSLLDELGIEKAALVGNSMGGMTSVTAAIAHPDRVSHLVTMGVPAPVQPLFAASGAPSEGMKILLAAYLDPTFENMKHLVQVMCFDQSMATDELARARSDAALARPDHLDSWNSQFVGSPSVPPYFDLVGQLGRITAPTMAIHGRDDRVIHYENSLHLATQIANSRAVVLNRCGHWAQIEHAAEFNRLVTGFIGG